MKTTAEPQNKAQPRTFQKVGQNLYKLDSTGGYYAFLRTPDKQFRRSLRTSDRKLAERRLTELRAKIGGLATGDDGRLTFEAVSERWLNLSKHAMKPRAFARKELTARKLTPFFAGLSVRNITPAHCEKWLTTRATKLASSTFVQELGVMKGIFEYAIDLGLALNNPARSIKRPKVIHRPKTIPTREQFRELVAAIRQSDGRARSQALAKSGADLVELLAYSGCRLKEATSIRWGDIDFKKNTLTVTGGDEGTKNREQRTVPITTALKELFQRLKKENQPSSKDETISRIESAKKCLITTCRRLDFPQFTHHDFRHFFATTCIESGVDIPTVSRWLGHKDGGALAMRVYGHLRQEHSSSAIRKVTF